MAEPDTLALGAFDRDTDVVLHERDGESSLFAAEVSTAWRAGRGPHGGYLAAMILRALEEALYQFAGCAVVISHDRWFLDRVATHIMAFEGDAQVVWFEGNYQAYEADRKRRLGADADRPHRIRYKKLHQ